MQKVSNPKWLLLVNTLPLVLLFAFYLDKYQVVKTLLSPENIRLWKELGAGLAVLGLANLCYALYLMIKRKPVNAGYAILALAGYITFLYIYGYHLDAVVPWTIPTWILPEGFELYVGTFLMPTLIHALFVLVLRTTANTSVKGVWKDFSVIVVVPLAWYLLNQLIMPLWKPVAEGFALHVLIIFTIAATLIFLFFLVRGVYIVGLNNVGKVRKYQLLWKIPFTLVFPLAGLALNNGKLTHLFPMGEGVFGDFTNAWFYILAAVNGILLCLPRLEHKPYRLVLFAARCVTFSYTVYFLLVFLPYFPLSVIAIIAIGTGFLMLTPLVLFVIHVNELTADARYLAPTLTTVRLALVLVAGMLVFPTVITVSDLHDRAVLNTTLDYLYNPDYARHYAIDTASLSHTMHAIEANDGHKRSFIFNNHTPYLSAYFNWLVLDNLTLSQKEIATINAVFFNTPLKPVRHTAPQHGKVVISKLTGKSRYDAKQHVWISQVDLALTNHDTVDWQAEYATTLKLPAGCWISGFYLDIGGKKVPGLLAEKKSAMWVYSQIQNAHRDPGILYYLSGNRVALRVFPFARSETRKTGIEFIHKAPFVLKLGKRSIQLGEPDKAADNAPATPLTNVAYVSAKQKATLTEVTRQPYWDFIVDVSAGQADQYNRYLKRIRTFLARQPLGKQSYKLTLSNAYTHTYTIPGKGGRHLPLPRFEGGFYLARAIKTILLDSYQQHARRYPVMVVVSDEMDQAVLGENFADWRFAYPESDTFYSLGAGATLAAHSLLVQPRKAKPATIAQVLQAHPVLAYPDNTRPLAYLARNAEPEIVLRKVVFTLNDKQLAPHSWQSALRMQAVWRSQLLQPAIAAQKWGDLVRASFRTGIMTPLTSYLVVENEAQRQMLIRKQRQVLAGNKALAAGEETQTMSEPGLLTLLLLLGLVGLVKLRVDARQRRDNPLPAGPIIRTRYSQI